MLASNKAQRKRLVVLTKQRKKEVELADSYKRYVLLVARADGLGDLMRSLALP
jgi:hypothetical protein